MTYSKEQYAVLQILKFEDKLQNKIGLREALTLCVEIENRKEASKSSSILILLQNLIFENSGALDEIMIDTPTHKASRPRTLGEMGTTEDFNDTNKLSPIDVFISLYQCCDPLLKESLGKKLFLCKLAIPFLFACDASITVDNWPLQTLCLDEHGSNHGHKTVLDMETHVVAFARIGRPRFSKSEILNSILCGQSTRKSVFFDRYCKGGDVRRRLNHGFCRYILEAEEIHR